MKKGLFILALFFIPLALAGNFNYEIIGNEVISNLTLEGNGALAIDLPNDFSELDVSTDYFLESPLLLITSRETVYVEYITKSLIEKSGNEFFFISKNDLHPGEEVLVILPEGAVIIDKYITFPKDYSIETNGKNIILHWDAITEKEILIPYKIPSKTNWILYAIALLFICSSAYLYYLRSKSNKESKTKNLYGEEKEIMRYLLDKEECWTKEMVKDLGISKVKLSRRLRNLEQKGLVKREPHGNENRIKLKKV